MHFWLELFVKPYRVANHLLRIDGGSEKNRLCFSQTIWQTTARTNCHQSPVAPLNSRWESILRAERLVCRSMQSRTRRTWLVCSREQSDAVAGCTRTLSRCSSRHVRSAPSEPRSRYWRASPGGRRGRTSGWSGWTESHSNIRHSSWLAVDCIGTRVEYLWWLLLDSPLIYDIPDGGMWHI